MNFKAHDKMSDLITNNYSLLQVLSRFNIPMGFGNNTVLEVCNEQGIDAQTFLCVANFITEQHPQRIEHPNINIKDLLLYLKQAHIYFLEFNLPTMRRKLVDALSFSQQEDVVVNSILNFFDEYAAEVKKHMLFENKTIFLYIEKLLEGQQQTHYSIAAFASKHKAIDDKHVEAKLSELKNIIIKYYPQHQVNYLLNSVLADIFNSEQELAMHCYIEDYILVPAVLELEKSIHQDD